MDQLPDYRLTCIFIDEAYRRQGISALALNGALDLIARAGFTYVRPKGKGHTVMRRTVMSSSG